MFSKLKLFTVCLLFYYSIFWIPFHRANLRPQSILIPIPLPAGFNEMKDGLVELIQRINAAGRAMTREDVETFFAELRNKRRRIDVDVPDNCR